MIDTIRSPAFARLAPPVITGIDSGRKERQRAEGRTNRRRSRNMREEKLDGLSFNKHDKFVSVIALQLNFIDINSTQR